MNKTIKIFLAALFLVFSSDYRDIFPLYFILVLVGLILIVASFLSGAWPVALIGSVLAVVFLPLAVRSFKKSWQLAVAEAESLSIKDK